MLIGQMPPIWAHDPGGNAKVQVHFFPHTLKAHLMRIWLARLAYPAGNEANDARVWWGNQNVVQAHLPEQRQRARQTSALLHQQWPTKHEGPQVQVRCHA